MKAFELRVQFILDELFNISTLHKTRASSAVNVFGAEHTELKRVRSPTNKQVIQCKLYE